MARAEDSAPPAWYFDYDWTNAAYERKFVSPLETQGRVTSNYGWRKAPVEGATGWHGAVDLYAVEGTPVFAAYPGVLVATADNRNRAFPEQLRFLRTRANPAWVLERMAANRKWKPETPGPFDEGCGNFVIEGILPVWNPRKIYYPRGTLGDWDWGGFILYCHLSKVIQPIWTAVRVEDQLAESGATGMVTGAHLHVAIYLDPVHLPPELRKVCAVQSGNSGTFEGTCPVDPQRYLFSRSKFPRVSEPK